MNTAPENPERRKSSLVDVWMDSKMSERVLFPLSIFGLSILCFYIANSRGWLGDSARLDSYVAKGTISVVATLVTSAGYFGVKVLRVRRSENIEARNADLRSQQASDVLTQRLHSSRPFKFQEGEPLDIHDFVEGNCAQLLQGMVSNAKLIDMAKSWIPSTGYYSNGQLRWHAMERLANYVMDELVGHGYLDMVDTRAGKARLTSEGRKALERMAKSS